MSSPTVDFREHHWAELGVVLNDGSYLCYDCVSIRGEHRCHGSDGAWKGAPPCTCQTCHPPHNAPSNPERATS